MQVESEAVTGRACVGFEHMSSDFAARSHEIFRSLHQKCPVAWSEAGNYWVVSGYDAVAEVAGDDARFSSHHDFDPASPFDGASIPPSTQNMGFIEMDPPRNQKFRKPWQRWFSPRMSQRHEPRMREVAAAVLDRVIENGRMDLVKDFASPVPAIIVLEYLGLPTDDWESISDAVHSYVFTAPTDPNYPSVLAGWTNLSDSIAEEIKSRRARPRDDLLSAMVHAEIEGEEYTDELLRGDMMDFVSGGVDTTTAWVSFTLLYLSRNPAARQLLIDEPQRRVAAGEELLRYFSPITSLARTVTRDTTLGGQHLKAGERVLLCWGGANLDESEFPHAEDIILDRSPNRHAAFGLGSHRCIGSNFARSDYLVMLDEVLRRIPDYEIDESTVRQYPGIGVVNGFISMEASFTPGPRTGARI